MNKFSLYEILSFIVPGFLLISIVEFYNQHIFSNETLFDIESDIEKSIIYLLLSLFFGLGIHILTFYITRNSNKKIRIFKWFNFIAFRSVKSLSKSSDFLVKIIPFLNNEYRRIREHEEEQAEEGEIENNLFDTAYYYLETNDVISHAKNYQSLYYLFRNMFTISILLFAFSMIIFLFSLSTLFNYDEYKNALNILCVNTILLFLISIMTVWLRKKFVKKILYSYYSILIHEKDKNNK